MPNMKLVKKILATTFALTLTTATFAATHHVDKTEKVIVSTQELPEAAAGDESAQPMSAQPASETTAEDATQTPSSHNRS